MEQFILEDIWPIAVAIFVVAVVIGIVMWLRRPSDPNSVPIRKDAESDFEADDATRRPPD